MSRLHPFARLCVAAVGLLVAQLAAGLGLAAVYIGVKMVQSPGQPVEKIIASLTNASQTSALLLTLFVYPVGLLWLGFCRARFDKRSFVSLGLRRARSGLDWGRGALTGFLCIAVVWAILWITGTIAVNGWSQAARGPNVGLALAGWAIAFAAVGFFEEFVFRGYALHNLCNWLGWRAAVVVQATLFALVHLGNVIGASQAALVAAVGALPSIFGIAVFFALCYRKTGSLWFPIGFHTAWNFSLGCLFSLPVSGLKTFQLLDVTTQTGNWLSGGSFGAEGSFFLLPILAALICLMLRAPDHPQALLDLELARSEKTPQVTLDAATAPEPLTSEPEPARENRYRTKFGTSEGFDGEMLRELRELQRQREAAQAQERHEITAQPTIFNAESLQPLIVAPSTEPVESPTVVALPEPVAKTPASEESPALERAIETETPVAPQTPKIETTAALPATSEERSVAPQTPVPPKKARPKW